MGLTLGTGYGDEVPLFVTGGDDENGRVRGYGASQFLSDRLAWRHGRDAHATRHGRQAWHGRPARGFERPLKN
jgi:hypothetical protein